ncbi:hypothetical protein LPJ53_002907 [Coemansia erecta]|uniref:FYR N-terminal domain-containing protein n=1 Tax=Coemansia erecta TaxID=147472 RepID=A0A9W8CRD4_9FUNG|nr:hypothetical protein LPJ53_002907 [Coemansia erecta]
MARELTTGVNAALERRERLLKSYQDIKHQLRLIQAENNHFLDMIAETFPEVKDDLSSSSSDSDSDSDDGNDRNNDYGTHTDASDAGDGTAALSRRYRKRHGVSPLATDARMVKRRRRQGKRDDRNDPKPIEPVARDSSGNIIFPMVIGHGVDEVRILSLGTIVSDRDSYHTSRYIWPVGFKSARRYPSMLDGMARCEYTSEILDGGDMPVFQVTAEDMPESPFRASSSSGVWKQVLDVLMANGLGVKTHASGPQMYGLSNLAVTKAIQELEGADKCSKYIMQKWLTPNGSAGVVQPPRRGEDDGLGASIADTSPPVKPPSATTAAFYTDDEENYY